MCFLKTAVAGIVVQAALCLAPATLSASVIYSNISGSFPGKSVSNQFAISNGYVGTTFVTTGSGTLASIETALYRSFGLGPVTVGLYTDHYGAPSVLLETWTVPLIPQCCANVPAVMPPAITFTSVQHPVLSAATKYWFVANLGTANSVFWWFNDESVTGGWWVNNKVSPLNPGAEGSPTPGIQLNAVQVQPPSRIGVLSHIAAGGGWTTVITLANTSPTAVPVIVGFHDDLGNDLSLPLTTTQQGASQTTTAASVSATLNPDATLLISMGDQLASTAVGWADVQSTVPLGGYAIFRYTPTTGSPQEGTVPLQTTFPATLTLPYDNTTGFTTGVALANLASTSASVTASAWDDNGSLIGRQSIQFAASGHTSFDLPTLIPQTTGKLGIITFDSGATGGIAGLGLRFSPFSTFTSVPVIAAQ